ncbi:FAD:protein FMN transferase [Vibrio ouci]|uniref:FAD:protein FMN transferase n=1 Tax=Vibrio ouci TaxID=2499078 RepID=A0A4Y8WK97_9VIBR|nr:FAD:protein FMN transferase [Vibrio ouci]TFH93254.1 FAD:protein FMN transferase [Vibrio ouci]
MHSNRPFVHRFKAMTVPCEVQLFGSLKASQIAEMIEQNTRRLEQKYNFYSKQSWLTRELNQRSGQSVLLDDESLVVFQTLKNLVKGTAGVFDPTVGSLKWLLAKNASLSRAQVYQMAQPMMGEEAWHLEGSQLCISHQETRFDLGGVIKEFAIDQAFNLAQSLGVTAALINFGGDIRVLGSKPNQEAFNVAVVNPNDPTQAFFSLPLANSALTTSAHYERKTQFSDEQTSHILSDKGTHPKVLSVTVVAPSALEAGAISTALTIDPLLPVPDEVGVIFIDDQLKIHQDTEFLTQ